MRGEIFMDYLDEHFLLFGFMSYVRCFDLTSSIVGGYHGEQRTLNRVVSNSPEWQRLGGIA